MESAVTHQDLVNLRSELNGAHNDLSSVRSMLQTERVQYAQLQRTVLDLQDELLTTRSRLIASRTALIEATRAQDDGA